MQQENITAHLQQSVPQHSTPKSVDPKALPEIPVIQDIDFDPDFDNFDDEDDKGYQTEYMWKRQGMNPVQWYIVAMARGEPEITVPVLQQPDFVCDCIKPSKNVTLYMMSGKRM